jgi:hypothetical protein
MFVLTTGRIAVIVVSQLPACYFRPPEIFCFDWIKPFLLVMILGIAKLPIMLDAKAYSLENLLRWENYLIMNPLS